MKKNFLLLTVSIISSLILAELLIRSIIYKNYDYDYRNTFLLFEQGKVFKNIKNIFVFYPNTNILSETYYLKNQNFIQVNSYSIKTNNYGLAQEKDLASDKDSLLILGDSFTQGQGYGNWTDKLNNQVKKYQIINAGILGTGPQQFLELEKYLSESIPIKKVFLLYLGDDFRRDLYNHDQQRISCLKNYKNCNGFESFYGFPLSKKEPYDFLNFLKKKRFENKDEFTFKKVRRYLKKKIYSLYIVNIPVGFLRNNFYKSKNKKILRNFDAIEKLINKYGNNIYFINLKQKDEIINKKKSYETIYANNFLSKKTKNIYECNFNNDLNLFFKYDSHPNENGYRYLYKCIDKIIKNNL